MKTTLMNKVGSVGYISLKMFPHWTRLLIWSLQLPPTPYKKFASRLMKL